MRFFEKRFFEKKSFYFVVVFEKSLHTHFPSLQSTVSLSSQFACLQSNPFRPHENPKSEADVTSAEAFSGFYFINFFFEIL